MIDNLAHGLTALGNGPSIGWLVAGSLIGMFVGVIPGLGGIVILSITLALINHINLEGTLCLFLATQAGSFFSASVTSILLNTPAHPEAFAVTFDGFPMAQRGEAGRALGISATSTCMGGLIGCACLVGLYQVMNPLSIAFHPPEYIALIALALILVGTLGTDAVSKGLISAGLGLMVSAIGPSPITGVLRYTFGAVSLYGGIELVALALGCFAIPQMIFVFGTATRVARQDMMGREMGSTNPAELSKGFGRQVLSGVAETLTHWVVLIRSGIIGVVTGIIPGIGAFAANFLSYGVAQQTSRKRALFGTGIAEGIIAPEGSSLSKEAGGLIPVLALGIPGGIGGTLFLAALTIKQVKVGFGFATSYPTLPYEMMWIIALGGLIGTAAGVLSAPFLARITRVPGPCLVPFVFGLALVGPYISTVSFFAVVEVLVFAVIGMVLRRLRYSLASFIIGLVLGPTLETDIYLTRNVYKGWSFLELPLCDVLFALCFAVLILRGVQIHRDAKALRAEEQARSEMAGPTLRSWDAPYPLLAIIVTTSVVVLSVLWTVYGLKHYSFTTAILPVISGVVAGGVALWRLPADARNYVRYRHRKATAPSASEFTTALDDVEEPLGVGASLVRGLEGAAAAAIAAPAATAREDPTAAASGLPPIVDKAWGRHGQYTRELAGFAWVGGLVLGCYVLGFFVAIPAFCVAYALFATRRVLPRLRARITLAVFSAAVMWALTFEAFRVLHETFTPLI